MKGISSPSLGFLDTRYLKLDTSNDPLTNPLTLPKLNLTNASATFDDITTVNKDFTIQSTYSGGDATVKMEFAAPEEKDILFRIWSDGEGGSFANYLEFRVDRTFGTHLYTTSYLDLKVSDTPGEDPDNNDFIRLQTTSNVPEILTVGACDLKINAGGSNDLLLNDGGGNVGIGTVTPQGILDVSKDTDQTVYLGRAAVGSPFTDIAYFSHVDTLNTTDYAIRQNTVGATHVNSKSGQTLNFSINNTARMVIKVVNVGIGESDPQAKLHVKGSVDNEQLIVQANATQTANILEIQNSSSGNLMAVNPAGHLGISVNPTAASKIKIGYDITSDIGAIVGIDSAVRLLNTSLLNDDHIGYRGRVNIHTNSNSNVTGNIVGVSALVQDDGGSGVYSSMIALRAKINRTAGSATVTNAYGIRVEDVTIGSSNYAIYTNAGFVYFGDNVGIETDNPQSALHVKDGFITIERGDNPKFSLVKTDATAKTYNFTVSNTSFAIDDATAGLRRFTITSGGNVTIGATGFSAKLTITGDADDEQLKVVANATQNVNIVEFQDSSNNVLSGVDERGILFSDGNTDVKNVFIGSDAGNVGSGAVNNIFIGSASGNSSTDAAADGNIGIGSNTLTGALTGISNVAVGLFAGFAMTSGNSNVGVGASALQSNTTGQRNMAMGTDALKLNVDGDDNVAIGKSSLDASTSDDDNVGIGSNSLGTLDGGDQNVAIGSSTGLALTTGDRNIFIGYLAGDKQTTNSDLIIFDNRTRADIATEITDSILYGVMAAAPANQTLRINAVTTFPQDVLFTGGGGLPFGSFWGNEMGFTVAGGTGTFKEVFDGDITTGQLHNVTHNTTDENTLDIGAFAGMYLVTWSMSLSADSGAGKHLVGAIGVDAGGGAGSLTAANDGRAHVVSVGTAENAMSGTAILDLSANSEVGLMVTIEGDDTNITVEHVNLSIVQIGGT